MSTEKNILLTWDASVHGFVVTAKTLAAFYERGIEFRDVYYFMNTNLSVCSELELKMFRKKCSLPEALEGIKGKEKNLKRCRQRLIETHDAISTIGIDLPPIQQKRFNINSPTNYESIYKKMREWIESKYKSEEEGVNWYINVSPGTPQMHVVWLMLNAGGYLPPGTQLWSSQIDREAKKQMLDRVYFKPQTYLSDVLARKFKSNAPAVVDPTETISPARQTAEEKLRVFGAVPHVPLLLVGERGVGKSTYVEQMLFQRNPKQPFHALSCGIFSDELFRSELFGHKKGAFTGALAEKKGLLADFKEGGLLFLDEIHDLSLANQRALIQVLQTGTYYPLGATTPEKAKFRLVCATNLTLSELFGGRLAPDFFDRIAHFIVEIPPLRQSQSDLPKYWISVWKSIADFEGAPPCPEYGHLAKALEASLLPGNFRDLQRIGHAVLAHLIDKKSPKEAVELALEDYDALLAATSEGEGGVDEFVPGKGWKEMEREFKHKMAKWALGQYGNFNQASIAMGVDRKTISSAYKNE